MVDRAANKGSGRGQDSVAEALKEEVIKDDDVGAKVDAVRVPEDEVGAEVDAKREVTEDEVGTKVTAEKDEMCEVKVVWATK
ncbi:hypothetical protein NEMBOFW57_009531 [Staphylotrichum longicolle]|uniref:Uncharacterized protein n=1 Tax=Staphylotrichum longicolle TaxID=669026 RepID=A0AAD4EPJ0_9PEZI|nr:hypothetical protein NEMBOFW57_009531 [Staphylotrichum longicolle]